MGDILDIDAAQSVKVVGSDGSGVETTPMNTTSDGSAMTRDFTSGLASGSGSALNDTPIASVDLKDYAHIYVQLTGTFVADITMEGSIDGTNWVPVMSQSVSDNTSLVSNVQSATGIYAVPVAFRHFRARISDYTSGTVNASAIYTNDPSKLMGKLNSDVDLKSGQLVPTITNKFRIRTNIGTVALNNATYTTLFERTAPAEGLFFGFQAAFSNDQVKIRLTLDGGIVFDLSLDEVRQFAFNDTGTTRTQLGGFLTTIGNVLDFSSKFAIPYETDVKVDAISTAGNNINNSNWIVFLTEDV